MVMIKMILVQMRQTMISTVVCLTGLITDYWVPDDHHDKDDHNHDDKEDHHEDEDYQG